ncbi:hypothetical protein BX591_115124 [Paraburkholderia bryophila]|uniref:NADP oxidoreductase coenzyme F420-dependent n=1 Tax=Paraburkholderia bryophila TaxID=420952 RepID=A0A329BVI8_9BURK|nr:hypothetical protein BX591_115124 [Paraburkholderia bryophila]
MRTGRIALRRVERKPGAAGSTRRILQPVRRAGDARPSPFDLHGRSSSEVFAEFVPGARVVKAINHLPAALVSGDTGVEGGQRVLFLAGDDAAANATVSSLIERAGFFGVDLGSIKTGGPLFQIPGGQLAIQNLVRLG